MGNPTTTYITEMRADGELLAAMANFATVCENNQATLGLTAANVTEISAASTNFSGAYNAMIAARTASQGATTNKETVKDSSRVIINKWAKFFRARTTVPNSLLADLLVAPHSTPGSSTEPNQPLELTANANGEGWTELKWKRNGNKPATQFQIWKKTSPNGAWTMVASVTKTKWTTALVAGQYAAFQVVAFRAGMTSIPSTPVVLWDSGQSFSLELAA